MEPIIFSRDGVLRRDFYAYNRLTQERISRVVPLRAWETAVDPDVFTKSLHSPIFFEDGLTVCEMFENLAPWSDQMTGIACMDFDAFLEEVRNPATERDADLSHIEISYRMSIGAVPKFKKVKRDFTKNKDGTSTWNMGKPMKTGRLRVETHWDMNVMLTESGKANYDGSDTVSLSFSPICEWGHLPMRLNAQGMFYDETASFTQSAYLGTTKSLTRSNHPNITTRVNDNGRSSSSEIKIDAPTPTFFNTLIRGCLFDIGFYGSPMLRDEKGQELAGRVDELNARLNGEEISSTKNDVESDYDRRVQEEFEIDMLCFAKAEQAARDAGLSMGVRPPPIERD